MTSSASSINYAFGYSPPAGKLNNQITQEQAVETPIPQVQQVPAFNSNVNRISSISFNNNYMPPANVNDSGFDNSISPLNTHTFNVPNMHQFQGIGGYSQSMLSSVQQISALRDKCLRCNNQVYALERIGPIKGNIYHKICFKCLTCDRQLDLKTYYTNQINLEDRQIYCRTHAPKTGKGVFGSDNVYIQTILNAPKLDVMQKVDNKPKVIYYLYYLKEFIYLLTSILKFAFII